jgi:transposase
MNYSISILESPEYLQELMSKQKLTIHRDRLYYLYALKTQEVKSQKSAGALIGLKERQSQNLWQLYRKGGLSLLLDLSRQTYFGKLSSAQMSLLRTYLKTDQASSLADIQEWLQNNLQATYTLGGICLLCKRLKIKLKTGRPTNVRQDKDGLESFKKTSMN